MVVQITPISRKRNLITRDGDRTIIKKVQVSKPVNQNMAM